MMSSLSRWFRSHRGTSRASGHKQTLTCKLNVQQLEDRTVPSALHGALFEDVNGDGNIATDPALPLAGVTMYLDQNQNGLRDVGEATAQTNATGEYSFAGLAAGTYYVTQEVSNGWAQTSPGSLAGPGTFGEVLKNFSSPGGVNYAGLAWVGGELYVTPARNGLMYKMDPATGATIGSPMTIPAGVGEITFDGQDFWGADYANDVLIKFDTSGTELLRYTFSGGDVNSVEWDGDSLWVLDSPAHMIHDVDPGTGSIVRSISTGTHDAHGFAFDGRHLWLNSWSLGSPSRAVEIDPADGTELRSFVGPSGQVYGAAYHDNRVWLHSNPLAQVFQYDIAAPGSVNVSLDGFNDTTGANFGNFRLGTISGTFFEDVNQDGTKQSNEGVTAGWRAYIDGNGSGQFDPWEKSGIADAGGVYAIENVRPGSYSVREDLTGALRILPHWSQTGPEGGAHSVTIDSLSGDVVTGKDLANYLNRVDPLTTDWADINGTYLSMYTGLMVYGEAAVYDWNTARTLVANSVFAGYSDWRLFNLAEAQSAAAVNLLGDAADEGSLSLANRIWWTSTTQGNQAYSIKITEPGAYTWLVSKTNTYHVAGVRDSATIIDDGSTGYIDTNWTPKTGGYLGDYRQATSGNGSKSATWTFSGLEAGATYKIVVNWKNANANASNAPFTVLDNTIPLATVPVNQKVAPNDFQVDTAFWEGIGSYTTNSGTLKVQLSNNANGTVVADGVRVFRVYPSFGSAPALHAAGGQNETNPSEEILTASLVEPVLAETLRRWQADGVDVSAFTNLNVQIANLSNGMLGMAAGNTIWLDDNAAGWGWFVDPTPWDDSEFTTAGDQGEQHRIDLLTVLAHELGHLLGLDHEEAGVMNDTLATGSRETPAASWTTGDSALVDLTFAGEHHPLRRKGF